MIYWHSCSVQIRGAFAFVCFSCVNSFFFFYCNLYLLFWHSTHGFYCQTLCFTLTESNASLELAQCNHAVPAECQGHSHRHLVMCMFNGSSKKNGHLCKWKLVFFSPFRRVCVRMMLRDVNGNGILKNIPWKKEPISVYILGPLSVGARISLMLPAAPTNAGSLSLYQVFSGLFPVF